jgi:hypothetical protein
LWPGCNPIGFARPGKLKEDQIMYAGPLATLLLLIVIGIGVAFALDRLTGRRVWFAERRQLVTASLVGIAGSFIGYHLFAILGIIIAGSLGLFIGAIIFAAIVLWLWRDYL